MPGKPSNLGQFWQELKRRKVVRVIIAYAMVAYVIIELANNTFPALGIPDWGLRLVIILIVICFPIALIVSWIFDVTPEGIKKTEPIKFVKEKEAGVKPAKRKLRVSDVIIAVLVVVVCILLYPKIFEKEKEIELEKSIAVLPFKSLSDDPEKQYLADGTMDAILFHLSKINDLRVMARTSVEQYRETDKTATAICQELDVAFLLEGSFQKYGDQVRLIVQLITPGKEDHIWSNEYNRNWKDIFSVQSEVAQTIAVELQALITPEEKQLIEKTPTKNLEAYDYYLLGKHYLINHSQDEDSWRAIEYFQQALEIDSTYALAYSGLASVYTQLIMYAILSPNEAYPKAKEYSTKALEFNEELALTHCILGIVKQSFEYDFTGAEKEYLRALKINPSSSIIHRRYAVNLSVMGRHDEAISHADLALDLDPLSRNALSTKYLTLFYAGYKSEALKLMEEARDSDPDYRVWYWFCAIFYTTLGMFNEALSMLQTQIALMGNDNISDEIGLLGYIYGQLGQKDKANKQLDRLDELSSKDFYVSPRTRVWVYMGLDNIDRAIEILEKAYEDHSIDPRYFRRFNEFDSLRNNPRFIELLKNVGIKE